MKTERGLWWFIATATVCSLAIHLPNRAAQAQTGNLLDPQTVIRERGRPVVETIAIPGDRYSFFMEPFILHIRNGDEQGNNTVAQASVELDGIELLGPRPGFTTRTPGFEVEVPLSPTSTLDVELRGRPGSSITLWIEAPLQPPPVIEIFSPERSATLEEGTLDSWPVAIEGEACHPFFPITSLTINGTAVPTAGTNLCEPFYVVQDSRWGQNVITGTAQNARGRTGSVAQAYLRSPTYFGPAIAFDPAERAARAVFAQLNQEVIDDSNRTDSDDLATLIASTVNNTDLNALIPAIFKPAPPQVTHACGPLRGQETTNTATGFRVRKGSGFTHGPFVVHSIQAVSGALAVSFSMSNISVPLVVTGYVDAFVPIFPFPCLGNIVQDVTGFVGASLKSVSGTVGISLEGGVPTVDASSIEIDVENITVNIDFGPLEFLGAGILDGITDFLVGSFGVQLETLLETAFEDIVKDTPILLLQGVEFPGEVTLPPNDVRVFLQTGLDLIDFNPGFGRLGLFAQAIPERPDNGLPDPVFGAIQSDGAPPPFSAINYGFGVGLKDDLINQILWAGWRGGAFDLADVSVVTGGARFEGVDLAMTSHLPPVIMPGATPSTIEVGMGDVFVDALIDPAVLSGGTLGEAPPIVIGLFLSAVVRGTLGQDEQTNRLVLVDPASEVSVQVTETDAPLDEGALSAIVAGLMQDALTTLAADVVGEIPLSRIDLGGIANLPPGTFLQLRNAVADHVGTYSRLTGSLQ